MLTPSRIPGPADLRAADVALRGRVVDTPLIDASRLARLTGARSVRVKVETFQHTGSFKFRGALWRCLQLSENERKTGVVAYSSGNFGQGLAAATQSLGVPCTIVMPVDAPENKRMGAQAFGAKVVLTEHGAEPREKVAGERAAAISRDEGATLLHPFDDPFIIAGHASLAYEVGRALEARRLPLPDEVLCCVGGGGLIAGLALGFKDLNDNIKTIPVEPEGYDGMGQSLKAGERITVRCGVSTICDALQATAPGVAPLSAMMSVKTGDPVAVTDADVLHAMRVVAEYLKIILEPSGAVAIAALLKEPHRYVDRDVLVVASGGNTTLDTYINYFSDMIKSSGLVSTPRDA